jgi:hypothetical protein
MTAKEIGHLFENDLDTEAAHERVAFALASLERLTERGDLVTAMQAANAVLNFQPTEEQQLRDLESSLKAARAPAVPQSAIALWPGADPVVVCFFGKLEGAGLITRHEGKLRWNRASITLKAVFDCLNEKAMLSESDYRDRFELIPRHFVQRNGTPFKNESTRKMSVSDKATERAQEIMQEHWRNSSGIVPE